jgi:hypothetical protein
MKLLIALFLCFSLMGCVTARPVIMPTLIECPEPTVPKFVMIPSAGHIGSLDPMDALMENVILIENYAVKLHNSNECYKGNVRSLQEAFTKIQSN